MEDCGTKGGKPRHVVRIENCGTLEPAQSHKPGTKRFELSTSPSGCSQSAQHKEEKTLDKLNSQISCCRI